MTIEELKKQMIIAEKDNGRDWENLHYIHDNLLLEYINNVEVTEIFNRTTKWHA